MGGSRRWARRLPTWWYHGGCEKLTEPQSFKEETLTHLGFGSGQHVCLCQTLGAHCAKLVPFYVTANRQRVFSMHDGADICYKSQGPRKFHCQFPPIYPFFLSGGWLQSQKFFISAHGCKLQNVGEKRSWDNKKRNKLWAVLMICLNHAAGACRASSPAQPQIESGWSGFVLSSLLAGSGKAPYLIAVATVKCRGIWLVESKNH